MYNLPTVFGSGSRWGYKGMVGWGVLFLNGNRRKGKGTCENEI